jgi:replicative DNA helicase
MTPGGDLSKERQALLEAIRGTSINEPAEAISMAKGFMGAYQEMTRTDPAGYRCGVVEVDKATGGLKPGHVWVIGAPTNWGKSSLLIAIADHHLSAHSSGVLLVTCEDATRLLFTRWLSRRAKINGKRARDARLRDDELERAAYEVNRVGARTQPVMVDGRGRSVEALSDDIRALVAAHGIRLVLVDYLQCMKAELKAQDRRAEINHIGRMLTDAIKTSGAAGVIASQLTGDDIRESRDIEHAAEVVLIGRKSDTGALSLFLKKNKTGPSGFDTELQWDPESGTFETAGVEAYNDWLSDS